MSIIPVSKWYHKFSFRDHDIFFLNVKKIQRGMGFLSLNETKPCAIRGLIGQRTACPAGVLLCSGFVLGLSEQTVLGFLFPMMLLGRVVS